MLSRQDLYKIFLLALLVRIAHVVFLLASGNGLFAPDSALYVDRADWFCRTGEFLYGPAGSPTLDSERMYGYIVLLAGLKAVFGSVVIPVVVLQSLIDAAAVCMISAVASRLGRCTGLSAGVLAAFWPNMVLHSTLLLSDSLALAANVGVIFFFVRVLEKNSFKEAVWMSICIGLSLAIRPSLLPLVPVIASVLWGYFLIGDFRSRLHAVALGCLPFIFATIFLMPQVLRIERDFGTYGITSQQGTHLLSWITAEVYVDVKGGSRDEWASKFEQEAIQRAVDIPTRAAFKQSDIRMALAWEKLAVLSPTDIAKVWVRRAAINAMLPSILVHPVVQGLKSESYSAAKGDDFTSRTLGFVKRQSISYLSVLVLSGAFIASGVFFTGWGLVVSWRRYPKITILALGYCVYYLVLTGPVLGPKYTLPNDPVIIVWISIGMVGCWNKFQFLRKV